VAATKNDLPSSTIHHSSSTWSAPRSMEHAIWDSAARAAHKPRFHSPGPWPRPESDIAATSSLVSAADHRCPQVGTTAGDGGVTAVSGQFYAPGGCL
jgi:hypothetical protein